MAFSKTLVFASLLLLSLLVVQLVHGQELETNSNLSSNTAVGDVTKGKLDCRAACAVRCSATKRPNLCQRACGSCCARCNCVPPGTSGNYEACPCYGSLTTHGNRHKCP